MANFKADRVISHNDSVLNQTEMVEYKSLGASDGNVVNLTESINNFLYVAITNKKEKNLSSFRMMPTALAMTYPEIKVESFDGARYRGVFTNDLTFTVNARYYAYDIEIFGIMRKV